MKISKYVLVISAIIGPCSVVEPNFSYMDTVKSTHKLGSSLNRYGSIYLNDLKKTTAEQLACLLVYEFSNDIDRKKQSVGISAGINKLLLPQMGVMTMHGLWLSSELPMNAKIHFRQRTVDEIAQENNINYGLNQYNQWYANEDSHIGTGTALVSIGTALVENCAYRCVSLAIEDFAYRLNQSDSVKDFSRNIPEHQFVIANGKLISKAAIIRSGMIIYDKGLNGINGKEVKGFGKDVAKQVGCYTAERYVVNPFINKIMGTEESLSKDVLSLALNYAAYSVIHSAVGDNK